MNTQDFLYKSHYFQKAIKGLNLTKTLFVSSIIIGPPHIGKKTLARLIMPNALFIDTKKDELYKIKDSTQIVIYNFEQIKSYDKLNFQNKNILALANKRPNIKNLEEIFAFIYEIPPLSKRKDDLELLINYYIKNTSKELMIEIDNFNIDKSKLDLSQNNRSLKASIYKEIILSTLKKEDIENILYNYFLKNLEGSKGYYENISIFEKPLIEAGLKKYKSQLKLSNILGINRNTLRKKIDEHNIK